MIRDILSIRPGECRYCLTDDTPFIFCGDPVQPDSSYCVPHHAVCNRGFGQPVAALESMMRGLEHTVVRRKPDNSEPHTFAVDVLVRE